MTVRRIGQHDAGDERPERRRKPDQLHHCGRRDDGEQTGYDEHFALAQPADEAEQGTQEKTARQHQTDDRADRLQGEDPAFRPGFLSTGRRQGGDDRDQWDDRQILEQQDGKGPFSERRAQPPRALQHGQDLRRRREAKRQADGEGRIKRKGRGKPYHPDHRQTAQRDLCKTETEDRAFHPPQPLGIEFEPDDEQQQHDAEFGEPDHVLAITAGKPRHLRTDDRPRDEITERRTETQLPKDEHEHQCGREQH